MKKKKAKEPKYQFNIFFATRHYPDFVTIKVHETQKEMMTNRSDRKSSTCEAFFRPTNLSETLNINPDGSEQRIVNNCYGEVHFYLGSLTLGIIAHELYHVVTNWAWEHSCIPKGNEGDRWENGIIYVPSNEERCAELIGALMAQTVVGLAHHMGKQFGKTGETLLSPKTNRQYVL